MCKGMKASCSAVLLPRKRQKQKRRKKNLTYDEDETQVSGYVVTVPEKDFGYYPIPGDHTSEVALSKEPRPALFEAR